MEKSIFVNIWIKKYYKQKFRDSKRYLLNVKFLYITVLIFLLSSIRLCTLVFSVCARGSVSLSLSGEIPEPNPRRCSRV